MHAVQSDGGMGTLCTPILETYKKKATHRHKIKTFSTELDKINWIV